jgi:hypothetical protein
MSRVVYFDLESMRRISRMNGRTILLLVVLSFATSVLGCNAEPSQSTVKGSVTLDGQPLAEGRITFIAVDAGVQTAEAKIASGQYEAAVPPGEKRVEIRAPKVTGRQKMYDTSDSPTVDVVTELLPRRYNVDSTLTMTVEDGEQEKSFELTGK